ncbi:MAG TPA: CcdC protein domain-containing protein [Sphingomonas sp.]|nr:CcdC protein domain-containing protein [Sphingomonas sp.]
MHVQTVQPHAWISYLITAAIVGLVLFFRMRRMSRMRPLKLEQLWIVPALYLGVVAMLFAQNPPHGSNWAVIAIGLLVGAALGWQRGKFMDIHVDPETHALNQKASIGGVLFLVALIAVKMGAQAAGGAAHVNVGLVTDTLAALALGMFSVQRLEMYLRAKRLLAEARGARA